MIVIIIQPRNKQIKCIFVKLNTKWPFAIRNFLSFGTNKIMNNFSISSFIEPKKKIHHVFVQYLSCLRIQKTQDLM